MIAARIGLTVEQFDSMTPCEFSVFVDAYNKNMESEQEQRMQEIYTSALLISRFVWCKGKPPSYEKVFGNHRKTTMTDEEMLRKVEFLNAVFGGNDTRKAVV